MDSWGSASISLSVRALAQSLFPPQYTASGSERVYGLGRFPITLYEEQWTEPLAMADDVRAFITANDSQPETKG